jgi:MFS family permease
MIDSAYAARRLFITLLLMTLGGSSMYVVSVVLPEVQKEFGISRADASLPYTLMMLGFGAGGLAMGKLADKWGVHVALWIGALGVGSGFVLAGLSSNIWWFALSHGVLMGVFGSSSTFAPLLADTSLWWNKRRGIAVAVCASGNYVAGSIWPALAQQGVEMWGWRETYVWIGVVCGLGMLGLSFLMRQRPPMRLCRHRAVFSSWPLKSPLVCRSTQRMPCCVWPAWRVVWPWPCPKFISWRIALTLVLARHEALKCCR